MMKNSIRTKQLEYWQGTLGNQYIVRNSNIAFFRKRRRFFSKLLKNYLDIRSILEVGCNIGMNLQILQSINNGLQLYGIEPNKKAVEIARSTVTSATIEEMSVFDMAWKDRFDLVFTSGVLIHIVEKDLSLAFEKLHTASKKYILSIEYYAPNLQLIPYHGFTDALFKRPYDTLWLKQFPSLVLLDSGFLDKKDGFDNCHWWLYRK